MKVSYGFNKEPALPQLDITAPNHGVQVQVSPEGDRVWVNVDGVCVLRICQIQKDRLEVDDPYTNELQPGDYGEIERDIARNQP